EHWFPTNTQSVGVAFAVTKTAFVNSDLIFDWFRDIFLPDTKPANPSTWRLLLFDGHVSHLTDKLIDLAWFEGVILLAFPSHATHILQPLDLTAFGALKIAYRTRIAELFRLADGAPQKKKIFYETYMEARKAAFSRSTLRKGWAKAG